MGWFPSFFGIDFGLVLLLLKTSNESFFFVKTFFDVRGASVGEAEALAEALARASLTSKESLVHPSVEWSDAG